MARTFRRKHTTHPIAELNVTNLIDLGFMLMIISWSRVGHQRGADDPGKTSVGVEKRTGEADKDARFVAIGIDAKANSTRQQNHAVPLTECAVASALRRRTQAARHAHPRRRHVSYQRIVQLMDELKRANLRQFTFDTQTER